MLDPPVNRTEAALCARRVAQNIHLYCPPVDCRVSSFVQRQVERESLTSSPPGTRNVSYTNVSSFGLRTYVFRSP